MMAEQKKQKVEQYIMVGVGSNTFDKQGVNLDFSRKIEVACQSDVKRGGLISMLTDFCRIWKWLGC